MNYKIIITRFTAKNGSTQIFFNSLVSCVITETVFLQMQKHITALILKIKKTRQGLNTASQYLLLITLRCAFKIHFFGILATYAIGGRHKLLVFFMTVLFVLFNIKCPALRMHRKIYVIHGFTT